MTTPTVRWEDLLPQEFEARLADRPIAWLPLGLPEPHGHVAAFGLDTHKAVWLCEEAARRFGGVMAPPLAYHVHETGYHAPWLAEVMEGANPRLAALPPQVVYQAVLYLLRAFRNAGFRAAVLVSGHAGGNQHDLRTVARAFCDAFPFECFVCADPELVEGLHQGDHAGRFEVSQLLAIRPDLVDLSRAGRAATQGRFAQNPDAHEATAELGRAALEAQVARLGEAASAFRLDHPAERLIGMEEMEPLWDRLWAGRAQWRALNLW